MYSTSPRSFFLRSLVEDKFPPKLRPSLVRVHVIGSKLYKIIPSSVEIFYLGFDKKGNRTSIRGPDEQKAYRSKVRCCNRMLDAARERSNNDTAFFELLETDEAVRTSLREQFISDCWKGGSNKDDDEVDSSYMLNYSIVDSWERYSHNAKNPPMGKKHFRVFDILGYERLIVVGVYRRYAEWIVSAYGQSLKKKFLYPNLKGVGKSKPCTAAF
jgi:hypothetical protein